MKQIRFDDPYEKKNINLSNLNIYNIENQFNYLNNIIDKTDCSNSTLILRDIKTKYNSYKYQDIKKKKYNPEKHITFNELLDKLYESKLKCYYCNSSLFLLYKKKKEPLQWSLERFDNNIGHYKDNTCISCLKCNLQRRTDNHEYFKLSKNINIEKLN